MKKLILTLFIIALSVFGFNTNTNAQGGSDPIPGIDIIIKEDPKDLINLYRCEDGSVVENSSDCKDNIVIAKYIKVGSSFKDGLDRVQESLSIINHVFLCDDGTEVSLPSECDEDIEDITMYLKINNVKLESDIKQGGNDPVPGIDIIIKEAGKADFYRCEDGSFVKNSSDCKDLIVMASYIKIDGIKGESKSSINSVFLCEDGTQVSLPSECDIDIEDITIFIKIDDIKGESNVFSKGNGGGKIGVNDIVIKKSEGVGNGGGSGKVDVQDINVNEEEIEVKSKYTGKDVYRVDLSIKNPEYQKNTKIIRNTKAYKKAFDKKVNSKIKDFTDEKLLNLSNLINKKIEGFIANTKYSKAKKERKIAIYSALLEIIHEKLGVDCAEAMYCKIEGIEGE